MAPIDLHGLSRFVLHFLVNPTTSRSDLAEIDPDECQLARVSVGAAPNFFHDTCGRKLWIAGQQCIDLWFVWIQNAAARSTSFFIRRMIHAKCLRDRSLTTAQPPRDGAPR